MGLGTEEAVAHILDAAPEFSAAYEEHLTVYEALLFHLFMAELAEFTAQAQRASDEDLVDRLLAAVERVFVDGDSEVDNAVALSFVEYLAAERKPEDRDVIARFPRALAKELRRQEPWRRDRPGRIRHVLQSWRENLFG